MTALTPVCITCGYALAGLPADGACPECATAVDASLHPTRTGSVWQRRAGGSTAATLEAMFTPLHMMRRLEHGSGRNARLMLSCTGVATAAPAFLAAASMNEPHILFVGPRFGPRPPTAEQWLATGLTSWLALWLLVLGVVSAYWLLLRISAALQGGGRVLTSEIWSHAALALVAAAALGWVAIIALAALTQLAGAVGTWRALELSTSIALASLALGVVWFLVLSALGHEANRPDPTPPTASR